MLCNENRDNHKGQQKKEIVYPIKGSHIAQNRQEPQHYLSKLWFSRFFKLRTKHARIRVWFSNEIFHLHIIIILIKKKYKRLTFTQTMFSHFPKKNQICTSFIRWMTLPEGFTNHYFHSRCHLSDLDPFTLLQFVTFI